MASVDIERIIAYEKAGRIRVQQHPELPLFIANYTERTAFGKDWDDLTLMCRGLIFDAEGTIVARPFKKFFNLGEGWEPEKPAPLPPDEPFTVTEKMDGSLGILYPVFASDHPLPYYQIASRGSFTSEQAQRANAMLERTVVRTTASDGLAPGSLFQQGHTYLFEIVFAENRIVVNYGDHEALVLLAIIDNETGEDVPLDAEPWLAGYFPIVRQYGPFTTFTEFLEALPERSPRDDYRERIRAASYGLGAVSMQEGSAEAAPAEARQEQLPAGVEPQEPSEERPVHGLQAAVPDSGNGLRPCARDETLQCRRIQKPSGAPGRDSQARRGVLQLPPTADVEEGYVIRFQSGLRLKLKNSEYLRLHRLVTGINSRRIWECMAAGQSLDPLLERVPDEFYDWVTQERDTLLEAHRNTCQVARMTYDRLARQAAHSVGIHDMSLAGSTGARREARKAFALLAQEHKAISGLLFTLFDSGDIDPLVWKMIRPEEATTPYAPAREV